MATPAEYPSWEQRSDFLDVSPDWCRLRWYLKGTVASSLHVLRNVLDPNSAQDPYITNDSTHSIATSSLTLPPISEINVSIYPLDQYRNEWSSSHGEHADEGDDQATFDEQGKLVRCCGEDRPGPGPTLQVKAESGRFVTIGDYVEAVHPWLEGAQNKIRAAQGVHSGLALSMDFDLIVYPLNPARLYIYDTKTKDSQNLAFEWDRIAKYALKKQQQAPERELEL